MKTLSLALLAILLCIAPAHAAASDQEITKTLVGTWVGKQKGFQGTLIYRADGVCISHLVPVDFLMKMFASPYDFQGTWTIRHGELYSTVTSSSSHAIKKGTVYKNEILKLNSAVFMTRNERGWVTEFKKSSQSSP